MRMCLVVAMTSFLGVIMVLDDPENEQWLEMSVDVQVSGCKNALPGVYRISQKVMKCRAVYGVPVEAIRLAETLDCKKTIFDKAFCGPGEK